MEEFLVHVAIRDLMRNLNMLDLTLTIKRTVMSEKMSDLCV